MEDLSAATLDDVKEFFQQYYSPNNLSLVIAGDFDPAEAKKLVAEVLRRPAARHRRSTGRRRTCGDARRRARRRSQRPYLARARLHRLADAGVFHRRRRGARHRRANAGRRAVLAPEQGARLRQAAGHAGVLVQHHRRDRQRVRRPGDGAAGFVAGRDREAWWPPRSRGWPRKARRPPSSSASKTKQEAEFVSGLERIGGFGGKADVLNQYNTFLGDPNKIEADLSRYRSLTTAPRAAGRGDVARHPEPRA